MILVFDREIQFLATKTYQINVYTLIYSVLFLFLHTYSESYNFGYLFHSQFSFKCFFFLFKIFLDAIFYTLYFIWPFVIDGHLMRFKSEGMEVFVSLGFSSFALYFLLLYVVALQNLKMNSI